jgi:hypothetical protein
LAVSSSTGVRARAGSASARSGPADLQAVHPRHEPVEHHQVGAQPAGGGQPGLAVGLDGHLQAQPLQAEGDEVGDDGVVVDHEDVRHGALPSDGVDEPGIGRTRV